MKTNPNEPHKFCETPEEKCTMNYCDDNGCQNRKRELVNPYMGVVNGLTEMVNDTLKSEPLPTNGINERI